VQCPQSACAVALGGSSVTSEGRNDLKVLCGCGHRLAQAVPGVHALIVTELGTATAERQDAQSSRVEIAA